MDVLLNNHDADHDDGSIAGAPQRWDNVWDMVVRSTLNMVNAATQHFARAVNTSATRNDTAGGNSDSGNAGGRTAGGIVNLIKASAPSGPLAMRDVAALTARAALAALTDALGRTEQAQRQHMSVLGVRYSSPMLGTADTSTAADMAAGGSPGCLHCTFPCQSTSHQRTIANAVVAWLSSGAGAHIRSSTIVV